MAKKEERRKRRDRYDVSGNVEAEYFDAEKTVLVNKKGISDLRTLQLAEEEGLVRAYRTLFAEVRMDTPITCELLQHIHGRIFGDLYDWAGRWRTVWISKPGTTWPPPDFLDQTMQAYERDVLRTRAAAALGDDDAFCAAVAMIQGEFLVIHPFREGNARTIKLLTNVLAVQTGRPILLYDASEEGQDRYIAAAKAAFRKDYDLLKAIIQDALDRARRLG
ncbi:MAG: Fic/DOC family protein [Thermoguttaceae bacterium]